MSKEATVSVIIPCWNQGHFLAEAIDSALGQTYPHVEVVVVDDGSTDMTAEVAGLYGERVKYVFQKNAGLPAARNTGIRHSSGEFIALLDSDDRWLPRKLEVQAPLLLSCPKPGLVYSGYQCFTTDPKASWVVTVPQGFSPTLHDLLVYNFVSGGTPVFPRTVLDQVGWFDERLRSCEDWDLWMRIAARYPVIGTADIVAEYRRYEGSMSTHHPRMLQSRLRVLAKNAGLHSRCRQCRQAVKQGRQEAHATFSAALCRQARQSKADKQYLQAVLLSLQAIRHNPQAVRRMGQRIVGAMRHEEGG